MKAKKGGLSLKPEHIFYCSWLLLFQANFCRLALLVRLLTLRFLMTIFAPKKF